MVLFTKWMVKKGLVSSEHDVFAEEIPEEMPYYIAGWIMDLYVPETL
jgi:hypothetical protein